MSSDLRARRPPETAPPVSDVERSAARYLFAIADLSEPNRERVRTGELQEWLEVSPASVTEMVAKLDDDGLVEYEKYQGVRLTDRGQALATRVSWRFCVVATFFESVLDATLDDETAFDIGFVLPKEGISRLGTVVGSQCLGFCPEVNADVDCPA